ncbi:hypothetical protein ACIRRA_14515 [Nocardia sp. NPDC101769]|uniref:hypothetical protein n=1 Tax=Nocardia sp. NPDC101769 TaxID=3364333 RepID=UPI0037FF9A0B
MYRHTVFMVADRAGGAIPSEIVEIGNGGQDRLGPLLQGCHLQVDEGCDAVAGRGRKSLDIGRAQDVCAEGVGLWRFGVRRFWNYL